VIDKTVSDAATAVADIPDGATVMIGGFPQGSVVNLGIGAPTLVANILPGELERAGERGVDVEALLDPAKYTGLAARLVDDAVGERP
jgi:hypothetical protein